MTKASSLSPFQKTTFANGVRVISESLPHHHTTSLGIWIDVGSRDEDASNNGISHFLEHMFFKGTRHHSARQLATRLDALGGMANAFTAKDTTCLYATVLDKQLAELINLLGEMLCHSIFSPEEISREQQVILQEIAMAEDTPEDVAAELFEQAFWGDHPLRQSILGPSTNIENMDQDRLTAYLDQQYHGTRILISGAGKIDHEQLCAQLFPYFGEKIVCGPGSPRLSPRPQRPTTPQVVHKSLEQVQLILGVESLPATAANRLQLVLLNILLGGNMSSRLFQQVREKRGLAYSISSFMEAYNDCGLFGISSAVAPDKVNETLAVICQELHRCGDEGSYSSEEFQRTLDYAKASLYLAAENPEARMTRNARNELYFGRNIGLAEVTAGLQAVTHQQVAQLAQELFQQQPLHATLLGPISPTEVAWRKILPSLTPR